MLKELEQFKTELAEDIKSHLDSAVQEKVQTLIGDERAAIVLDETKGYLVEARLTPLCPAEGFANVPALIAALDYAARAGARVILLGFPGAGAGAAAGSSLW